MMKKISFLGGFAVGLIILVDIATGQGPPGLNNYLGPPVEPFRQPVPFQPIGYVPRGEYDEKIPEKELYKEDKDTKYESSYHSTPAPGVLSSFSNTMTDAWKSLTAIGRQKRSAPAEGSSDKVQSNKKPSSSKARTGEDILDGLTAVKSTGRSFDDYEWRQSNNQGYIFFKVPKSLVCYN